MEDKLSKIQSLRLKQLTQCCDFVAGKARVVVHSPHLVKTILGSMALMCKWIFRDPRRLIHLSKKVSIRIAHGQFNTLWFETRNFISSNMPTFFPHEKIQEKESTGPNFLRGGDYERWHAGDSIEGFQERSNEFDSRSPAISVVTPVYNTPLNFLQKMIMSVKEQIYDRWELCIADDCSTDTNVHEFLRESETGDSRIKVTFGDCNVGISSATNRAASIATGEFLAFVDSDDQLTATALAEMATYLCENPDTDVLYSDQDKIDCDDLESEPFYKPKWSPIYFLGVMYVGHLLVVRRSFFETLGGFDAAFDKVQDFELVLRLSEVTDRIRHIPDIIYHWRMIPGSGALRPDAKSNIGPLQVAAVNDHLKRCALPVVAAAHPNLAHRITLHPGKSDWPDMVSIIVHSPQFNHREVSFLETVLSDTTYKNVEMLIVGDCTPIENSCILLGRPIRYISTNGIIGIADSSNRAAERATGKYIIFMECALRPLTPDWIQSLVFHMELPNVGAVSPLILGPNGTVCYAGIAVDSNCGAFRMMYGYPPDCDGYNGTLCCTREVTSVTSECMMVRRDAFLNMGGFNQFYRGIYPGVDLSLRLLQSGQRNLYVPRASLRFVGSGDFTSGDPLDRSLLIDTWAELINDGDQYWSPKLASLGITRKVC